MCEYKGYEIYKVHEDAGISAKTGNTRPAFKELLEDIKDKIDKLKISKLNKDNYILSKEDKDSFFNFIEQVDSTNIEYVKLKLLLKIMKHLI